MFELEIDGPVLRQSLPIQQQAKSRLSPEEEFPLVVSTTNKLSTPNEFNYSDENDLGDGFANCY